MKCAQPRASVTRFKDNANSKEMKSADEAEQNNIKPPSKKRETYT